MPSGLSRVVARDIPQGFVTMVNGPRKNNFFLSPKLQNTFCNRSACTTNRQREDALSERCFWTALVLEPQTSSALS